MKNGFLFIAVALVHFVAQFVAWGYAERGGGLAHAIWAVLSTPLLLLAGSLADEYFWVIAIANSFLWSALLLAAASRLLVKRPA